jgi:hypothetical protein
MIFDANGNVGGSYGAVNESPYELGLSGALMHVYETECNYNAMMKAVGLSELKYYQETGKDLFLNEAGAFGGFIEKAKALFKKIIEKIKAIFKKFMAKINSYTMSDKDFVKKYKVDILKKNITDMKFTGYAQLKNGIPETKIDYESHKPTTKESFEAFKHEKYLNSDDLEKEIAQRRGSIIGEGELDEAEFRDALKEKFYGDKETYDVDTTLIRAAFSTIESSKTTIKEVEKAQNNAISAINKVIRSLESLLKDGDKALANNEKQDDAGNNNAIQCINNMIDQWKAYSNDITVAFSVKCSAYKDANRQAKALCVKVLSYNKKESARLESGSDIFSNVTFA